FTSTPLNPHIPSFPTRRSSDLLPEALHLLLGDDGRQIPQLAIRGKIQVTGTNHVSKVARDVNEGLWRFEDRAPAIDNAGDQPLVDRKSTRLNSSHQIISYAVFC